MKFYDTDTHEIFEATAAEFTQYMDLYHEDMIRDRLITGAAPHIFIPRCPSLKGHRHFVYKPDERYVMIKFEDKFVHFRWNDELKGKPCFLADNMEDLRIAFEHGDRKFVKEKYSEANPFKAERGFFHFAYFDPNYDCKVAFNNGQTIQVKMKGMTGRKWKDISDPSWEDESEYRIKPEGLQWTDLRLGDILVHPDEPERKVMVTEIDPGIDARHIYAGCRWFTDEYLAEWRKVNA